MSFALLYVVAEIWTMYIVQVMCVVRPSFIELYDTSMDSSELLAIFQQSMLFIKYVKHVFQTRRPHNNMDTGK